MWSAVAVGACAVEGGDDAGPTCAEAGETRTYRIDRVMLPAQGDGLDLDGDGSVDNRAAAILAAVFDAYADHDVASAWQAQLDARLATQTTWQVRIATCPDGATRAAVIGADARDLVDAIGTTRGTYVAVDGGGGAAPLGAFADLAGLAGDGWHRIDAVALRAEARDGELTGLVGGAFAPAYPEVVAASFLPFLNQLLDDGATYWGDDVDADDDGEVELDELLGTALFRALLRPDLDTVGGDGDADALSFGFEIHGIAIDAQP